MIFPTAKFALLALLAASAAAGAQTIGDPTLPPPSILAPAGAGEAAAVPAGPLLQSILVSREAGGRRLAVISGVTVRQGGRVGGAIVESVGENEVVLRRGRTREVLRLYPLRPYPTKPAAPAEQ